MVYINENSNIVSFPKNSVESFDKIHFVNQVTKFSFDLFTTDLSSDNKLIYTIDISPVIDKFEAGQYDYTFQKNNGTVICSGIIQYEGFTPNVVAYNTKSDYIQYTPDETIHPESDTTITITENDTYNVEDYDTAIVNVKGSGGMSGRVEVVNVNSTPYKHIKVEADGGTKDTFKRLNADILFNLNCDVKTLYENKDKLYIALSKYSNRRKKQAVINDVIKSDERLKVYCWVMYYEYDPIEWTYFYTINNFNDSSNELVDNDPEILVKRLPHYSERNQGSYGYNNNYATCLNELMFSGVFASEVAGDYTEIKRYPEGDIDKYFIGDISANPIEKWRYEYHNIDDDLDELIRDEKYDFFCWLSDKCVIQRGDVNGDTPNYCYKTYVGDYPIYPVKLADCSVIVWGDVLKEYFGDNYSGAQLYIKLSDLSLEQLEKLPQITLVLPFTANHIIQRLYLPNGQWDFLIRNPEILDAVLFNNANKIGGNKRLICGTPDTGLKTYFKLGTCNEEQLRTNNFRDIPQYDFKLLTFGNDNVAYWFDWNGEWRTAMITKVI
jgi:hypothetical protein